MLFHIRILREIELRISSPKMCCTNPHFTEIYGIERRFVSDESTNSPSAQDVLVAWWSMIVIFCFWLKSCSESAFKWEAFYILLVLKIKMVCACTDLAKQLGAIPCKIKHCVIILYYILPAYPMQWEMKKTCLWLLAVGFFYFPREYEAEMWQRCRPFCLISWNK